MKKDGIDYLTAVSLNAKVFLPALLLFWLLGIAWTVFAPERYRLYAVVSVGSESQATGKVGKGGYMEQAPAYLEPPASVVLRLKQVIYPQVLLEYKKNFAQLSKIPVTIKEERDTGIVVLEARVTKEQASHVKRMMDAIVAELLRQHDRISRAKTGVLQRDLQSVNDLMLALDEKGQKAADLINELQRSQANLAADPVVNEAREFMSLSRVVSVVQTTSNIENLQSKLAVRKRELEQALAAAKATEIELEPNADFSRPHGASLLLKLIIIFILGLLLAVAVVWVLELVRSVRKRRSQIVEP